MPISLPALVATLSSMFCSRASLLLEVPEKTPEIKLGGSPVA
jgi:hypothetical protein